MTDSTANNESVGTKQFNIHELSSFRSYPLGFAMLGVIAGVIGLVSSYATISVSVFGGGLKPFDASGDSAWLLSIPIGWIALVALLVGVGCTIGQLSESHSHKSGTILGIITVAAGVLGAIAVYFEIFIVSDRASNTIFGSSIDVSAASGYYFLLAAMGAIILAGVTSLVHFDSKK